MIKDIEDITCPSVDMNFILECSTCIDISVEHEKIRFVSTSEYVFFCLSYKHTNDVSEDFRSLSEDFQKFSKLFRRPDERFRTFFSEDTPNIPEEEPIMFRSYSNTPKDLLRDYVAIAMVIIRLVKISYFHL